MKYVRNAAVLAAALLASLPLQAAEIRVGFTLDALTLDPANHRKRETETILRNLYDGVLTRDDAPLARKPPLCRQCGQK